MHHNFAINKLLNIISKDTLCLVTLTLSIDNNNPLNCTESSKCTICDHKFTINAPKLVHKIYCQGFKICTICKTLFESNEKFIDHLDCSNTDQIEEHAQQKLCKFCEIPVENYEVHIKNKHNIDSPTKINDLKCLYRMEETSKNSEFQCICNLCSSDISHCISNVNALVEHYLNSHHMTHSSIIQLLEKCKVKLELKLSTLKKEENSLENVPRLLEINNTEGSSIGISDFNTGIVKCIYSSESDSTDSESECKSRSEKNLICCFCNIKLISKQTLLQHMHKNHGFLINNKVFQCYICKKKFSNVFSRRKHKKNVHRNKVNMYNCQFCSYTSKHRTKIR